MCLLVGEPAKPVAATEAPIKPTGSAVSRSSERSVGAMAGPQAASVSTGGTGLTMAATTDRKTLLGA